MKNTTSTLDFENAFKSLAELSYPKVGKIIPHREDIHEAVKHLGTHRTQLLMEEFYDVQNSSDLNDAKDSREAEVAQAKLDRIEKIVDLDADTAEDLLAGYVGKHIVQCPQCMTLFYKDEADIVPSEDDPKTVNVGEKCQHCGNEEGYIHIGKVAEAEAPAPEMPAGEEPMGDELPAEEGGAEEGGAPAEQGMDMDLNFEEPAAEGGEGEETPEEGSGMSEVGEEPAEEEPEKKKKKSDETELTEGILTPDASILSGNSINLNVPIDAKNNDVSVLSGGDGGLIEGEELTEEDNSELPPESDIEALYNTDEFKTPIDDAEAQAILADDSEEFDELDEESFDSALSEYLNEVYEDVDHYETNECKMSDDTLILEGSACCKDGTCTPMSFNFKKHGKTYEGYAEIDKQKISKEDAAYDAKCSVKEGKLCLEQFKYHYTAAALNEQLVEGYIQK